MNKKTGTVEAKVDVLIRVWSSHSRGHTSHVDYLLKDYCICQTVDVCNNKLLAVF